MYETETDHLSGEIIGHAEREMVGRDRPQPMTFAVEIEAAVVSGAGQKSVMGENGRGVKSRPVIAGGGVRHMMLDEATGQAAATPTDRDGEVESVPEMLVLFCGTAAECVQAQLRRPLSCARIIVEPSDGSETIPVEIDTFREDAFVEGSAESIDRAGEAGAHGKLLQRLDARGIEAQCVPERRRRGVVGMRLEADLEIFQETDQEFDPLGRGDGDPIDIAGGDRGVRKRFINFGVAYPEGVFRAIDTFAQHIARDLAIPQNADGAIVSEMKS